MSKMKRKLLSLAMTAAMITTLFAGLTISASASTTITTQAQLAAMTNGDYVLGANIQVDASTWTPINFSGTFDGSKNSGYSIELINTSDSSKRAVTSNNFGIFATNSGTISNLKVTGDLYLTTSSSRDYVSPVVGTNTGTINGVTNETNLYGTGSFFNVGGIAGYNNGGYILNSANSGDISTYRGIGGIVGYNLGTVNSCSNSGAIISSYDGKNGVGGIAGLTGDKSTTIASHIWNCYNTAAVSDEDGKWVGGICGFENGLSYCVNCYNIGELTAVSYKDHISGNTEGTNINCYGLTGISVEGYDNADTVTSSELQDLYSTLNSGNAGFWSQGSPYPVLNNIATTSSPDPKPTISNTPMSTTSYTAGDHLDTTGLSVSAGYANGTTESITDYTTDPTTNDTLSIDDTSVTISGSYHGVNYSFNIPITVTTASSYRFEKVSDPTKLSYTTGERFSDSGLSINAISPDGTTVTPLTSSDYTISNTDLLTANDTSITVSGTYQSVPFSYTFPITFTAASSAKLGGTDSDAYSSLTDAIAATTSTGTVYVYGKTTFTASQTTTSSVTIERASSYTTGALFEVAAGATDGVNNIVDLRAMTVKGGNTGTLFEVTSGTLRLRGNIKLKECATAVNVASGAGLTVNKAQITATSNSIVNAGTLVIDDFGGTTITGPISMTAGTGSMNGGTISGFTTTTGNGGGLSLSGGSFTMTGGTISGNTASKGGGVYVGAGTFAMTGGTISGNTASTAGSGVYVVPGATFEYAGSGIASGQVVYLNNTSGNSDAYITLTGNLANQLTVQCANPASNIMIAYTSVNYIASALSNITYGGTYGTTYYTNDNTNYYVILT